MVVAALVPMAQAPPRGLWRAKGGVRNIALSSWLGRPVDPPAPNGADPVGQALVRRYLAAHGPAATADLRAWSGLAGLPGAVAAVRDELVRFRDERGRELLDLPDAPRPDPDTPAPVRFLPAFDNAILGYQDRGRIIDDAHRGLSVAGERVVLVDGRVAATWRVTDEVVTVEPLRAFSRADRDAVADQGGSSPRSSPTARAIAYGWRPRRAERTGRRESALASARPYRNRPISAGSLYEMWWEAD